MRFHVAHVGRLDAGVRERVADDLLRGPCGTVRPLLRPSWFTADPRMMAKHAIAVRHAAASRFNTTTPRFRARVAAGRRVERLASTVGREHARAAAATHGSGVSITFTPPASASPHSPSRKLLHARWMATRDDEQAVSIDIAGPCRPRLCEASGRDAQRRAGAEAASSAAGFGCFMCSSA